MNLVEQWMDLVTDPSRNTRLYSAEAKKVALELLKQNDLNVTQTRKQLGLSHSALQGWALKAGLPVERRRINANKWIRRAATRNPRIKELLSFVSKRLKERVPHSHYDEDIYTAVMELVELLKQNGISVTATARYVGMQPATVLNWVENPRPEPEPETYRIRFSGKPGPKTMVKPAAIRLTLHGSPESVASILGSLGELGVSQQRIRIG